MNKRADFNDIGKQFHIDPVIARIIRNRDITDLYDIKKYLYGNEKDLYDAHLLKDADLLVSILENKIKENKSIRIINDYDTDGVCSGYILLNGLKKCGAKVSIRVPDRMKDGYGINQAIIEQAHNDDVDTIITCDNGIAAINEIAYAKSLGMTVLVTDHHSIPYKDDENGNRTYLRSEADAIVNPHQIECTYPFDGLCGAGVAYKVIVLLYEKFRISATELDELLEFAAFATVADVMDLKDENRLIVRLGLKRIRGTKNIGMRALIEANGLQPIQINSYHFGFILGPCVNASGRLKTAQMSLELFMETNEDKALKVAQELVALNGERKDLTQQGLDEALKQITDKNMENDKVLVVYLPEVHESLAGIIAGRIREAYYKPVFVLTKGEEGVKGSGRSIEEYSMFEEMNKCSEYLDKFGGHPMAAGLSLKEENISKFREALNRNVTLTEEDLIEKVHIDVPMPLDYATKELVQQFQLLEPFGKANTKPIFADKNIRILSLNVVGKNQNVLKMKISNESNRNMEAMFFGDIEKFKNYCIEKFGEEAYQKAENGAENDIRLSIIYYPGINAFRGVETLQITINDYI